GRIETSRLHVIGKLADRRGAIAAETGVEQHDLTAAAYGRGRERVGEFVRAGAGRNQGFFDLLEGCILNIALDATLGAAIVQAEDFNVANLVLQAVGGALGVRSADE